MLLEPASSVTDFALGVLAIGAALLVERKEQAHHHWRLTFLFMGLAAILGGVHHGFIGPDGTLGAVSWAVISLTIAVAISFLLSATIASVLGEGRGRSLLIIRGVSLFAFFILVILGRATIRLLKNGVWQWDRVLKTLILRSSWRKLGRWSRTLGLCCFLNPVLRGCRAWVAHCQVMPPWLLALPLPAPGVWPYGPDCRPWLPGTPPDRSGPAPDIASFGTRPLFSSTRRSPQPVSESAD